MNRFPGDVIELMQNDLSRVLTVKDVMRMYDKSQKAVQVAIWTGRLYAEKRDSDEGVPGGIWLISQRSAHAIWGKDSNDTKESE